MSENGFNFNSLLELHSLFSAAILNVKCMISRPDSVSLFSRVSRFEEIIGAFVYNILFFLINNAWFNQFVVFLYQCWKSGMKRSIC